LDKIREFSGVLKPKVTNSRTMQLSVA